MMPTSYGMIRTQATVLRQARPYPRYARGYHVLHKNLNFFFENPHFSILHV